MQDFKPYKEYITALCNELVIAKHRQLVIVQGSETWCYQFANQLALKNTYVFSSSSLLANSEFPKHAHQILGQEFQHAIFDGFSGLYADKLAALAGTVKAGGVLILLLPDDNNWQDPALTSITSYGEVIKHSFFNQRFFAKLKLQSHYFTKHSPPAYQSISPATAEINYQQQQACVEQIIKTATGRANRPLVISADRGRGKSAALGLAAANLQADFFNFIKESVEAETARLGHNSIVVDSGGDDAKQVSQIEDLITKQIDALVLIISGNTDGNAQIRKAKEAGIPVITVDRNTTNPPGDSFVASDSEVASYEMGMWVAEQTGGKGVVGVIQGQLGSTPEIARDTGFEDAIAQFPDLNTVEKQASKMWSRDEGVSIAQDLLTRNPNITVLYGRCDALAQGAAQAAKAMGRDDLLIVGFDGDRAALEDLKKGNTLLAATMTQQTLTIGRTATRFAIDAIEGRYIPPEVLYGSTLTTQDNVEQFMGDGHP